MTITWRLYSCDDHLDLWNLPRDLWEGRLPARLRERGPHVVEQGGNAWWTCDGSVLRPFGMQMMCGPRTPPPPPRRGARGPWPPTLGGRPGNGGGCGERSGGCERRARSSLLRRAFRHASSVVAALAALAPRIVRLAHHHYPDGLLAVRRRPMGKLEGK